MAIVQLHSLQVHRAGRVRQTRDLCPRTDGGTTETDTDSRVHGVTAVYTPIYLPTCKSELPPAVATYHELPRSGLRPGVKTERGEKVTTGNRTRVVRLAVTNANHYTKRSHDHLAWVRLATFVRVRKVVGRMKGVQRLRQGSGLTRKS
ncbi:hypothetical protein Bbelb_440660 [Branchiostoma belcheri]|nr:hypothetical protein Bbelb_440660 [Branchiostoma belcheri]